MHNLNESDLCMYEKIHKKISREFKGIEVLDRLKKKLIIYEKNYSLIKETLTNIKTIYEKEVEHYNNFDGNDEFHLEDDSYTQLLQNLKEKERNILTEIKEIKENIQIETENKEILDFISIKLEK